MLPQLSHVGASTWKRANWSDRPLSLLTGKLMSVLPLEGPLDWPLDPPFSPILANIVARSAKPITQAEKVGQFYLSNLRGKGFYPLPEACEDINTKKPSYRQK